MNKNTEELTKLFLSGDETDMNELIEFCAGNKWATVNFINVLVKMSPIKVGQFVGKLLNFIENGTSVKP